MAFQNCAKKTQLILNQSTVQVQQASDTYLLVSNVGTCTYSTTINQSL